MAQSLKLENFPSTTATLVSHPITANGLFTILLTNVNRRKYRHISFKLGYKIIKKNKESEWKCITFDYSYLCWRPKLHLNIKLSVDLFDYQIEFRISMLFLDSFTIKHSNIRKNVWLSWSNIITARVQSSMSISLRRFKVNSFVKFKKPQNNGRYSIGTIIDIIPETKEKCIYKISDKQGNEYNINYYNETHLYMDANYNKAIIKSRSSYYFIDLSDRMDADKVLLIGNRQNIDTKDLHNLYETMVHIFYEDYSIKYMKFGHNYPQTYMTMAQSVSIAIIDHLYILEYNDGYKIECPYIESNETYIHRRKRLQLVPFRKMLISRGWMFGCMCCDSCLCGPGIYDVMYHCEKDEYIAHDLCVSCVYDMVKKYDQLSQLLFKLLCEDLSMDCIQTVAVFVVGNVVK